MNVHNIDPVRRNLKFGLPKAKALSWNPSGLHVTQFYNSLSVFFPVGERFFIDSVRHFQADISDARLKEQISAFIGQEAFHGREHEEYNEALAAAGFPMERMEKLVTLVLDTVKKLPPKAQLSVTVALEHLTAILGDTLLRDPALLEGCDPHFAAIWRWHAMEETEHKAVCFDAYEHVMGRGVAAYGLRVFAFVMANLIFWSLFYPFYARMVQKGGGLFSLKGWYQAFQFQFGKPGVLRRVLPEWLDFFLPNFHPWMHDNRHYLDQIEGLLQDVAALQKTAA
jgi:predicted metal-dependent hydrolase